MMLSGKTKRRLFISHDDQLKFLSR